MLSEFESLLPSPRGEGAPVSFIICLNQYTPFFAHVQVVFLAILLADSFLASYMSCCHFYFWCTIWDTFWQLGPHLVL